jgi:ubiquinone/menaquinone biosynthesis C-methylase UbiE
MGETKHDYVSGKDWWDKVAESGEDIYNYICYGWDKQKFQTCQGTIWGYIPNPQPSHVVVDLGCGIGRIAQWVAPKVKEYIGVDSSPKMIEQAKIYCQNISNTTFIASDTLSILPPNTINAVVCEQVFIHLTPEQQFKYLEEIITVLAPDGNLCIQIPKAYHYVNGMTELDLDRILKNLKWFIKNSGLCWTILATKPSSIAPPTYVQLTQT